MYDYMDEMDELCMEEREILEELDYLCDEYETTLDVDTLDRIEFLESLLEKVREQQRNLLP